MALSPSAWRVIIEGRKKYLILKRAMDITISTLVILFVFPWMIPLVAVCIKFTSRGPVFFKQKRVGYLGRKFWCYKFRTMQVNDAADSLQASEQDPRITPIGLFLRKSGMDELPQFLNVWIGNMSIVGPRPHMMKDHRRFSESIPQYRIRHFVKPGITGLSQVKGCRGEIASLQAMRRRYKWDLYYAKHVSTVLDLKIMFQTAGLMLYFFLPRKVKKPRDNGEKRFDPAVVPVKKIA